MEVQRGSQTKLQPGSQGKSGKSEFDKLFIMFWPCRASLKNLLLRTCLGYRRKVKTEVHKLMPSKPNLGGSDGHLGPPMLIFGSPLGSPFGDKIHKNEPLQHMLEPLGSQDGPKVAASRPRLKINLTWCPQSMIFCYVLVVFHVIRETEHTQVSMDFSVSYLQVE